MPDARELSNEPIILTDIGELVVVPPGPLRGARMRGLQRIRGAALRIDAGRISWFGPHSEIPAANSAKARRVSAGGGCVIPGLIDCHTHIPFAGNRADEFVRRIAGESYLSIMQSGGGIRVTTRAVRAASLQTLIDENLPRLRRMLAEGVTTIECKSGYGLDADSELKQLRAVAALSRLQPAELVPTYLGAHALPAEYDGRSDEFIDALSSEALLAELRAGDDGRPLARFVDVFCDHGAFGVEQSRRYLQRAKSAGFKLKLHADELAQIGASRLAGELSAVSADHLEHIDDAGIDALRRGGVVAVVLPGTSFCLGIPHADARRLIDADLPVAVATDANPGSCPIESLRMAMDVACCQLRLTPEEVLCATTANAAAAVCEAHRIGAITVGHDADLVILETPSLDEWAYSVGRPRVRSVFKRGTLLAIDRNG
ncbi:MAG: imidazolonepropionase [Phycisphaerales bacterium]|nr:imidazolonepropionase [Phycisphaerales bacterium]